MNAFGMIRHSFMCMVIFFSDANLTSTNGGTTTASDDGQSILKGGIVFGIVAWFIFIVILGMCIVYMYAICQRRGNYMSVIIVALVNMWALYVVVMFAY